MKKEKQVTLKEGREIVKCYYPQANNKQADFITKMWNENDGIEYDDNEYEGMGEWLYISEENGYSLEDLVEGME